MKVAILSPVAWRTPPRHYGPWEQVASNVAEGLVNADMDVTLFATADSITSGKLESVIDKGYEEDRTQDAKVAECLHISNLMEKAKQFDIIHNHFDFLPLSYSGLIATPMLTTIHGFSSPRIIPVYQKYNASNHYVSISNADRYSGIHYIGTVYNGLRVDDFEFTESPEDYLLFFGRIHPDKGTAEAIEIARQSKKALLIAGIIQDQAYFDEKVKPFLGDQITFLGAAGPEKRNELLGKASALLHPICFNEPFGLSVAEAMLCGTPVIAFNKGAMPELIRHEKTGFLVENVSEAVEAVHQLSDISRFNCRVWAVSQFSQKRMVDDYMALYQQILW
ncbi:glycosyltransferase involved in cell wall biosynthesis [Catalinimonas alkaloidigena]|uniref:glycosyltransferase family 4 protein n=1 Tax=Catalinimonas alkaloidigena TaxID=1075417 RepID=UPI0024067BB2|nr:glycosyltransferase family 4 protein [Catalinimonas alkaloidigena]MDF9796307.1 glycosyltransferase involved in cell wall biosynthesis [Catalinimonas alkaloidigena]